MGLKRLAAQFQKYTRVVYGYRVTVLESPVGAIFNPEVMASGSNP
jgi:hypothetical protein